MSCDRNSKTSLESPVRSTLSTRESISNSTRKRKFNEEVVTPTSKSRASSSPSKKSKGVSINLIPEYLVSVVEEKSFVKTFTLVEQVYEFSTLEEIEKPDKFNLRFELFKLEIYHEQDVAVLRVRDGTICPALLLWFPKAIKWECLEQSIVQEPEYRSNEPVVDLLLFNCSFTEVFKLKEFFCYSMQNVMVVNTIGKKGLLMCANGKEAYLKKLTSPSEPGNQILSKTADKKYQELEEKYLHSLIRSPIKKPNSGGKNNISDTKKNSKCRESNVEDDQNEEKREKLKVGKFQTNKVSSKEIEIGSSSSGNKVRRSNRSNESVENRDSTTIQKKEERTPLRKLRSEEEKGKNIKSSPYSDKLKKKILSKTEDDEDTDKEDKIKSKATDEINKKTPKTNTKKNLPMKKTILSKTGNEDGGEEDEISDRSNTFRILKTKENKNQEEAYIQDKRRKLEVSKFQSNKVSSKVKEIDSNIDENKVRKSNRLTKSVEHKNSKSSEKKLGNITVRKLRSNKDKHESIETSPHSVKKLKKKVFSEPEEGEEYEDSDEEYEDSDEEYEDSDEEYEDSDEEDTIEFKTKMVKIKSETKAINEIVKKTSTPKTNKEKTSLTKLKTKILSETENDDSDEEVKISDTKRNNKLTKLKAQEDDDKEDYVQETNGKLEKGKFQTKKGDSNAKEMDGNTNENKVRRTNKSSKSADNNETTTKEKKEENITLRKLRSNEDKDENIKTSPHSIKKLKKKVLSATKKDEDSDEEDEGSDEEDEGSDEEDKIELKKKMVSKIGQKPSTIKTNKEETSSKSMKNSGDSKKRNLLGKEDCSDGEHHKVKKNNIAKDKIALTSKECEEPKSDNNQDNGKQKPKSNNVEDVETDTNDAEDKKLICYKVSDKSKKSMEPKLNEERIAPKKLRKDEDERETRSRASIDVKKSGLEEEGNSKVPRYKTLSELKGEHGSVNTVGVIKNILKEENVNQVSKWRIAVELVDQTQEVHPFKVHLFLPQISLITLNKVMEKNQIIELIGMKVGKFNGTIGGGVYAASSIELYNSVTGRYIEWRDLPCRVFEPTTSSVKIIQDLLSWSTKAAVKPKEDNQDLKNKSSDREDLFTEPNLSATEYTFRRTPLRKREEKTESPVLSTNKSKYYNILDGIVSKSSVDEVLHELLVVHNNYTDLEEITESMKVNLAVQVVNVNYFSELNLVTIQVRDGTVCPVPMLHIPLGYVWSKAKETIINNPLYTRDSPIVDILCFECKPHLPPLQIGKFYKLHNVCVVKKENPFFEKGGYIMCVETKDCEVQESRGKKRSELLKNENKIVASEAPFIRYVVQKSNYVEYYPKFLIQSSEKTVDSDLIKRKSSLLPSSEDSVDRAMCNIPIPDPQQGGKRVDSHNSGKKTVLPDPDSITPSSIDLDQTDGLVEDIPPGIAREIDSIMHEESMLGLPVTLSEDIHLRNTGTDPTYSQFAHHVDKRSKDLKTSTQAIEIKDIVCTMSSNNSINGQHIDSLDLQNITFQNKDCPYSSESAKFINQTSNKVPSKSNINIQDDIVDDLHTKAGSESILTHAFLDLAVDQNKMRETNKRNKTKQNGQDKETMSYSSDIEIVEENITPSKTNNVSSRNSSATKSTPEQPRLLIQALYEDNFKLPPHCLWNSDFSSDEELQSEECKKVFSKMDSDVHIASVVDFPNLPIASLRTYIEIRDTNCHDYTTIPLKLFPELEGDWEEKVVRCVCSKCKTTYVLNDLKKISSDDNDDWPNHKVPVCPNDNCNRKFIEADSAHFYFEMKLNAIKVKLTCTAILSSESAETFLDCSVVEFLNSMEKRDQVKSRLNHLFLQNNLGDKNEYIFKLFRKDMFDPDSGPLYIKGIRLNN